MYVTHRKKTIAHTHEHVFMKKLLVLLLSTLLILGMIAIFGELVEAKGNTPNTQVHVHLERMLKN